MTRFDAWKILDRQKDRTKRDRDARNQIVTRRKLVIQETGSVLAQYGLRIKLSTHHAGGHRYHKVAAQERSPV